MTPPIFNNRRIIWESKAKQVGVISLSFLFVAAAIWTRDHSSSFLFWGSILFWGGGGILLLYRLLNPKNLFVTHRSALGKQLIAEEFKAAQASLGPFSYDATGFLLTEELGTAHYVWSDLESVFGYKRDEYVTDEICLDLFFGNTSCLTLTESTPGWYQFLIRLHQNVLSIPLDWQVKIAVPVFETQLTLLFDKAGRPQHQVESLRYKQ
jgi:hypothetical protein